jgi:2-hydroxychromene-2-carboxylate isomerase/uncharacterized damage-inducible protein DinB
MSDPKTFQAWARYNRSFNARLYAAASATSEAVRRRDGQAFFGSIHGTLSHLVVADALWLHRVGALEPVAADAPRWPGPPVPSLQLNTDAWPQFADLSAARAFLDDRIEAWTATFTAAGLQADVTYATLTGERQCHPLWWVAAHVFNHQAHHRGQATTLLSQAGIDYGVTDLMVFLRQDPILAAAESHTHPLPPEAPTVEFYFDPVSPYSWLSTHRIEALARAAQVAIHWRPILLGPIFQARGFSTSPNVIDPDRQAWMWEDIGRSAADLGLAFEVPTLFPSHSVFAARAARVAAIEGWCGSLARALGDAAFTQNANLGEPEVVRAAIRRCGHDAVRVEAAALGPTNKEGLRADTEEARQRGVFGAPTFLVGNTRFWGDDRLEQALAYAQRG